MRLSRAFRVISKFALMLSVMALIITRSSPTPHHRVNRYRLFEAAMSLHFSIWYLDGGFIRDRLIESADARTEYLYARMAERARARGFEFQSPPLRQLPPSFDSVFREVPGRIYAVHYPGSPSHIIVDGGIAIRMSDTELSCLLAHELGHAIDEQMGRDRHPLTRHLHSVSKQEFAHFTGMFICGFEEYMRYSRRWLWK